jgi:hypothetical protein
MTPHSPLLTSLPSVFNFPWNIEVLLTMLATFHHVPPFPRKVCTRMQQTWVFNARVLWWGLHPNLHLRACDAWFSCYHGCNQPSTPLIAIIGAIAKYNHVIIDLHSNVQVLKHNHNRIALSLHHELNVIPCILTSTCMIINNSWENSLS